MALVDGDSANIEYGPCQVTYNSVDLGFFKGGVSVTYTVEYVDFEVDQSSMLVDSRVKSERLVATVPMVETDLATLTTVMPTGTYTLDSGGVKKKIEFGGTQISSSNLLELVITPVSDGSGTISTDANEKITIYKTRPTPQFSKVYNRDGERVIPVEFHAYRDSSKTAGKQLYILGDSTATA